jgi:hypothetical protein
MKTLKTRERRSLDACGGPGERVGAKAKGAA